MQDQLQDEGPAIDLAIRSGVVINALDVEGSRRPTVFNAERQTGGGPGRID